MNLKEYTMIGNFNGMFQKNDNSCGFAVTFSVCNYWLENKLTISDFPTHWNKREISNKEIEAFINGNVTLYSKSYSGSLRSILELIKSGIPVIVGVKFPFSISNHYQIVIGFSKNKTFVIFDPKHGYIEIDFDDFLNIWKKSDYLIIIIMPHKRNINLHSM